MIFTPVKIIVFHWDFTSVKIIIFHWGFWCDCYCINSVLSSFWKPSKRKKWKTKIQTVFSVKQEHRFQNILKRMPKKSRIHRRNKGRKYLEAEKTEPSVWRVSKTANKNIIFEDEGYILKGKELYPMNIKQCRKE